MKIDNVPSHDLDVINKKYLDSKIEQLFEEIRGGYINRNLFIKLSMVSGNLSEDNIIVTEDGFVTSDFIEVDGDFFIYDYHATDTNRVAFYDENKQFIRRIFVKNGVYKITDNTKYIRVSVRNHSVNGVKTKVEHGTKQTPWTPAPEDLTTAEEKIDLLINSIYR